MTKGIRFILTALGFLSLEIGFAQDKPNILLIVVDDLGYSDLSFLPYASEDVKTPNIDRIAKNGVFFTNAYATAPICSPARAGLLTGRYQQRWGNYWYGEGGLPAGEKTIPQFLNKAGYYTVKIGKTHLNGGPVEHPLDHGFQEFLGFLDHTWDYLRLSQSDVDYYGEKNAKKAHIGPLLNGRDSQSFKNTFTTDLFTARTLEVLRKKTKKPFFIQLSYNAVHHPTYVGHPDYLEKYGLEQFPFWDPKKESYQSWHRKWGHLGKIDPDGRKRYLLQLEVLDNGIGKILDELESSGTLENTIIICMSDNGGTINTYARNNTLNGYKYMFGEGGIRIPLLISFPKKMESHRVLDQTVSAMDILPTLLESAGQNLPENLDGKSLWPLIEENGPGHDKLVWSNGRDSWVVRQGDWKLAHNIGWVHNTYKLQGEIAKPSDTAYKYPDGIQLFDLSKDLSETTNLKKENPKKVAELTQIYEAWRTEMSDPRTGNGSLKDKPVLGTFIGNSLLNKGAEVLSDGAETDHYNTAVIDGYAQSFWKFPGGDSGKPLPHHITIALKNKFTFSKLKYKPVMNNVKGRVSKLSIYISEDGLSWGKPVKILNLPDTDHIQLINLQHELTAQFIKFQVLEVHDDSQEAAIAELDLE